MKIIFVNDNSKSKTWTRKEVTDRKAHMDLVHQYSQYTAILIYD